MKRICRRIGNRTFRNKRQAHNIIHIGGLAVFSRKTIFKKCCTEGYRNRRHHSPGHDRRHDIKTAAGQRGCPENISRFIKGPAHINGHHSAEKGAQKYFARTAHGGQRLIHPRIDGSDNRVNEHHHRADNSYACYRVNEHRFHALKTSRQAGAQFLKSQNNISGQKTGQQCSEETGTDRHSFTIVHHISESISRICHSSAHNADSQSRPVRNTHGNIS